ncbi:MAG: hypothetical protein KOO65_08470 [Desulfobacterales bacterium]|nr:hypothetical protein [Desulfobacterales bacterium]
MDNTTFTTTECVIGGRDTIIERSLASFSRNLGLPSKAIVNLDIFEPQHISAVKSVFYKYFEEIYFIENPWPNFPMAVKSVWEHEENNRKYVFHCECDWLLLHKINFDIIRKKCDLRRLDAINLRAYRSFKYKFNLSPILTFSAVTKKIAAILTPDLNPEWQIHQVSFRSKHWPTAVVLEDIGRDFLATTSYARTEQKNFTEWNNE